MASFRIDEIIERKGKVVVIATQLDSEQFKLDRDSRLGAVPVEQWMDQPRSVTPDGKPNQKLFSFQLKRAEDESALKQGQVVALQ